MKTATSGYIAIAEGSGAFYYLKIVSGATTITDDFIDFKYYGRINADETISFGGSCASYVEFRIYNPSIALENLELTIYMGIMVSGTIEYKKLGLFKVMTPSNDGLWYTYKAYDRMVSKLSDTYVPTVSIPCTTNAIMTDIATQASITFASTITNITITKPIIGYTYREIIGYISGLYGKNSIINENGELEFKWYTSSSFVVDSDNLYESGIEINSAYNFVLSKILCSTGFNEDGEDIIVTSGTGSVYIDVENPFMTQTVLDGIYAVIGGITFRPLVANFIGDVRIECGDIVTVIIGSDTYYCPIMSIAHDYDGGLITQISSYSETETEQTVNYVGTILRTAKQAISNSYAAQTTANGKNTVYYASTAPIGGTYTINDLWFDTDDGYKMYQWSGTAWAGFSLGTNALADLAITNAKIADATILNAKIQTVDAGKITTGYLSANRIQAETITTDKLSIGTNTNLLRFGFDTFEQYPVGTNNVPYYLKSANTTTYNISTDYKYYGTRSLKISGASTSNYIVLGTSTQDYGCVPVVANNKYRVSCYVYNPSATACQVQLYSVECVNLGTVDIYTVMETKSLAVGDGWYRLSGSVNVSTSVNWMGIRVDVDGALLPCYFDAFQIERITTLTQLAGAFKPVGTTLIDGGNITASSVTAGKISTTSLSALSANLGIVTAGKIQSTNYVPNTTGMLLDADNSIIDMKNWKVANDGTNTLSGGADINLSSSGTNVAKVTVENIVAGTGYKTLLSPGAFTLNHYNASVSDWSNTFSYQGIVLSDEDGVAVDFNPRFLSMFNTGFVSTVVIHSGTTDTALGDIDINSQSVYDYIVDSGRISVVWNAGNSLTDYTVYYRKIGKHVMVEGRATNISAVGVTLFTLGTVYRPRINRLYRAAAGGSEYAKIEVRTNGEVYLAAYSGTMGTSVYLDLSEISYFVE